MSKRASLSLTRALGDAVQSLPQAWIGAWLALIALWAFTVFGPHAAMHLGLFAHMHRVGHLVLVIILAIFKLMSLGALYRALLFGKNARREGLGLGGVQFHMPELRLFAAGLIIGLFILLIAVTLFVVFAIAFNLSGLAEGAPSTLMAMHSVFHDPHGVAWAFVVYMVAAWLLLLFLVVKFSLFHAATIAERRMVTLNALGLSSGNVGKLFVGIIVTCLPLVITGALLFHHAHRHFVLSPQTPAFDTPHVPFILHAILAAVAVFIVMPFGAGFFASAYQQIVKSRTA